MKMNGFEGVVKFLYEFTSWSYHSGKKVLETKRYCFQDRKNNVEIFDLFLSLKDEQIDIVMNKEIKIMKVLYLNNSLMLDEVLS